MTGKIPYLKYQHVRRKISPYMYHQEWVTLMKSSALNWSTRILIPLPVSTALAGCYMYSSFSCSDWGDESGTVPTKNTTLRCGLLESYSFQTKATVLNVSFWPEWRETHVWLEFRGFLHTLHPRENGSGNAIWAPKSHSSAVIGHKEVQ
jgi:hypothetical protein